MHTLVRPPEADPVLIVDANTVLASPATFQRFQMIARRNPEITQLGRAVQVIQPALGNLLDRAKPARTSSVEERLGFVVAKVNNQNLILSCLPVTIKQEVSKALMPPVTFG